MPIIDRYGGDDLDDAYQVLAFANEPADEARASVQLDEVKSKPAFPARQFRKLSPPPEQAVVERGEEAAQAIFGGIALELPIEAPEPDAHTPGVWLWAKPDSSAATADGKRELRLVRVWSLNKQQKRRTYIGTYSETEYLAIRDWLIKELGEYFGTAKPIPMSIHKNLTRANQREAAEQTPTRNTGRFERSTFRPTR